MERIIFSLRSFQYILVLFSIHDASKTAQTYKRNLQFSFLNIHRKKKLQKISPKSRTSNGRFSAKTSMENVQQFCPCVNLTVICCPHLYFFIFGWSFPWAISKCIKSDFGNGQLYCQVLRTNFECINLQICINFIASPVELISTS